MRAGSREFETVPLARSDEGGRGIGVADMADAILNNRPHRVNGEVGYHVLDLMIAFEDASNSGQHVLVESACARPAALPAEGWS
jgi:predicted dehydrogenase